MKARQAEIRALLWAVGTRARSGVYFYRLEARSTDGLEVRRRKAILVE